MLDTDTKRCIDAARDILVGKVPDPKSQVEQITIALISEHEMHTNFPGIESLHQTLRTTYAESEVTSTS